MTDAERTLAIWAQRMAAEKYEFARWASGKAKKDWVDLIAGEPNIYWARRNQASFYQGEGARYALIARLFMGVYDG